MILSETLVAKKDKYYYVHQSVLASLFAARKASIPVDFCNWSMQSETFFECMIQAPFDNITVVVSYTSLTVWEQVKQLYNKLNNIRSVATYTLRVIPNEREVFQEEYKIKDIKALDAIAENTTDARFSYRLKTC